MRAMTPAGLWLAGFRTAQMMVEAHTVIALRLWGMAGLWPVARGETRRMVTEKPGAFVEAGGRAMRAALAGKGPDEIAGAAVQGLRKKTRSNARRLSKRRWR